MRSESAAVRVRLLALAAILLALLLALLPALLGFGLPVASADDPSASPSPSPTESPSPDPSPTPTQTPSPTPDPTSTAPPTPDPNPSPSTDPKPDPTPTPSGDPSTSPGEEPPDTGPLWGTYTTTALDEVAAKRRDAGWSERRIGLEVYAPFIVVGPAAWTDSWHAPRYAGGFHLHEGQDVLCHTGAPVLSPVSGTVRFGESTLGGLAAYVDLPDGSFFYFAHLSSFATDLASGATVRPGETIGACGATGDATTPHVHFGWYSPEDVAQDPMPLLVSWLRAAIARIPGATLATSSPLLTVQAAAPSLPLVAASDSPADVPLTVEVIPAASVVVRTPIRERGADRAALLMAALVPLSALLWRRFGRAFHRG